MAESMFNTDGSLSSTDPKVIQAAMRATGGQILPSSPSFRRAVELSQLRDVQMKQGMAEGAQAVKSLKKYQAKNPPTISGLPSNQVVTSDTGFKAVLDAQGNIVGTNAPVTAGPKIYDKVLGASNDPTSGQNIRDAFLKEYAKPKPVQAVAVEEVAEKPLPRSELPSIAASLASSPAASPMIAALMALQQAAPQSPVAAFAPTPAASALSYVPYGTGENYKPVDAMGQPISAEVQTEQLVAATPTVGEQTSMFEAAALRKQEMAKREERDAALREGNAAAAKKLSDEISALRSKYQRERRQWSFDPRASNLEGLST